MFRHDILNDQQRHIRALVRQIGTLDERLPLGFGYLDVFEHVLLQGSVGQRAKEVLRGLGGADPQGLRRQRQTLDKSVVDGVEHDHAEHFCP